jgi:hypothetical protein
LLLRDVRAAGFFRAVAVCGFVALTRGRTALGAASGSIPRLTAAASFGCCGTMNTPASNPNRKYSSSASRRFRRRSGAAGGSSNVARPAG